MSSLISNIRDIDTSPEEVFIIDSRSRTGGTAYKFNHIITDFRSNNQHGLTHASLKRVTMTNDFFNIRAGHNGLSLTLNDGVSEYGLDIVIPAGKYNTISHLMNKIQNITTSSVSMVDSNLSVSVIEDTDGIYPTYKSRLTLVNAGAGTWTWSIRQSLSLKSNVVNDVSKALGFIDINDWSTYVTNVAANAAIISPHFFDIHHIRDVKIFNNLGKTRHGGCVEVLHFPGTGTNEYVTAERVGEMSHAFKLRTRDVAETFTHATDLFNIPLQGSGELKLIYNIFAKTTVEEFRKRIRML